MKISCPHCRQNYEVDESYIGQNVQCQNCGNEFMVTLPISETEKISSITGKTEQHTDIECPKCKKVHWGMSIELVGKKMICEYCGKSFIAKDRRAILKKKEDNAFRNEMLFDCIIGIIVLGGIIAFVIWGFVSCRSAFKEAEERVEKYGSVGTARAFVHDAITKRLKAPSTADIEITEDKQLDNEFTISGYVDAQNSFGAKIRNQFKAKVVYHPDKKVYMLAELQIY
nr:MAG TPA: zinc-ribbon domain protein [Caudoviricetes sp.]